ncbi:hypothetical protein [Spirosoma pollinicola]|nr:hypothetical protein [Spirosoma pollinicola]
MKTLLIFLFTLIGMSAYIRTNWFDSLDITSDKFDITWDDIMDDLWP